MRPRTLLIAVSVTLLLASCQRDSGIQTYRVSKETGDMAAMGKDLGMKPAAQAKEIAWQLPPGWTAQPPSAMRIGSFLVNGNNGQRADISIVPLSGLAGGDLANINRWRGQIDLPALSESELSAQSEMIRPAGRVMRLIDFVSAKPMLENRFKKRVVAAIYTQGQRSWFFKMIGEDQTVREAKPAFLSFLRNLRFHDAAHPR